MIKQRAQLQHKFGLNEYGFPDIPKKMSGIQISRLLIGEYMGCSYCFPHGMETINSRCHKDSKNWKRFHKTQYKVML
jgi:hypothetical protein